MTLLIGALTVGLILSLLALGVYISFRIFKTADMTADGSTALGGATAAVLLVKGVHPLLATAAGAAMGMVAGTVTGVLHARLRIHGLLAGILVMTALYSINLHIMGRSNVPLMEVDTLVTGATEALKPLVGKADTHNIAGWQVASRDIAAFLLSVLAVIIVSVALYLFMRTDLGTAMRATGQNDQMARAQGADTGGMIILGLALSNGLIAAAGALLAQYQGFADVQMGFGMIVWGLASIIIGESLVRTRALGIVITGAVMGSVLFRLMVAIALRFGLNPNDLKLITAVFVLVALVVPDLLSRIRRRRGVQQHA
ncbi:MAG TPA: ABC transporter permease [Armatimonadetes bacterium]|jgi:putative ABC transport system permease protein|nr:ABC transporter permease [Armatimonadota bacterium]